MAYILGIDLGGTQIKALALDPVSGRSLGEWITRTRDGEREGAHPAFAVEIRCLVERISQEQGEAEAIGLAAPGLADHSSEFISSMEGRLEGLQGLRWPSFLDRAHVRVLNDGQAALLGEVWQGAAKGLRDVFLLTLGTGVGGAILSSGKLLRGHIGRAGHLGHISLDFHGPPDICGVPGSLEDLVGNCTVETRSQGRYRSTLEMVEAAKHGDAHAASVWEESIRALAAGISSLINVLDPEAVIVGGGIAMVKEALFDGLARYLDDFEWRPGGHRVRVLPAELGEYAGAYGAAWFALNPEAFTS